MEITQLQKLQNLAARVITNSSFDAPSRPLIQRLGWKTIRELINDETKAMVFQPLHELALGYLSCLFICKSQFASHHLRNTATDLRLPQRKISKRAKMFFL